MAAAKKIKAAVFDLDGMLLDTRELLFQSYTYAVTSQGFPEPSRQLIAEQVGKSTTAGYSVLAPGGNIELIRKSHREFHNKNLYMAKAYEGLETMLSSLKKARIRMAVFTNRGETTPIVLENAGVLHFFDALVTARDVENPKPHPEGLLKALKIMSVNCNQAAMLGDAVPDIEAGKAAGVAITIGITQGFGTREALKKAKPDYIVDSLAEIPAILLPKKVK